MQLGACLPKVGSMHLKLFELLPFCGVKVAIFLGVGSHAILAVCIV